MTENRPRLRALRRGFAAALAVAAAVRRGRARGRVRSAEGGHPVRIIAYVAHPVGVVLDLLIFRPAHWIGSLPGLDEFFGHEPYDD